MRTQETKTTSWLCFRSWSWYRRPQLPLNCAMVWNQGGQHSSDCWCVQACKACLEAPIWSETPTHVILSREGWNSTWHHNFRRVAARLLKDAQSHVWLHMVTQHLWTNGPSIWPTLQFVTSRSPGQRLAVLMAHRVTQCVGSGICRWLGSSTTERISPNILAHVLSSVFQREEPSGHLGRDHLNFEFHWGV